MLLPDQALSRARDAREERFAVIYQHYADYLKAYNALDFDDLILLPVLLFRTKPEILENGSAASATSWWTNTRTPT